MTATKTELTLFTRGASNPNVTNAQGKGARWYVLYSTQPDSETAGKTIVTWELYKDGRTSSPTQLTTVLTFTIGASNNKIEAINGKLNYEEIKINKEPNSSGTNHPHYSYNPKDNTTPTLQGSFSVLHNDDGSGDFTMQITASIYSDTVSTGTLRVVTLEQNYPQSPCYWDQTFSSITMDRKFIAPGAPFQVRWAGASGGIQNEIKEFLVSYKIGSTNEWSNEEVIDHTNNFCNFVLPDEALRGELISARVGIVGTAIETPVYKEVFLLASVNTALGNLNVKHYSGFDTEGIFSYTLNKPTITCSIPLKSTGQTTYIEYSFYEDFSSLRKETRGTFEVEGDGAEGKWNYGDEKTLYIRATDGEENTPVQSLKLIRNSNYIENAELIYNEETFLITIKSPPQKSYASNKYQYNYSISLEDDWVGLEEEAVGEIIPSDTKTFDLRAVWGGALVSGETFKFSGSITISDLVDYKEEQLEIEIAVPKITATGTVFDFYYDKNKDDSVRIKEEIANWTYLGIGNKNENSLYTLAFSQGYGTYKVQVDNSGELQTITFLKLDFSVSNNKYKPRSERPKFTSRIVDNEWGKYGLKNCPEMFFYFDETRVCQGICHESSSNFSLSYVFEEKADYYNIAEIFANEAAPVKKTLYYSYINAFGNKVTQSSSVQIELDFNDPLEIITTGGSAVEWLKIQKNSQDTINMRDLEIVKEGMPLKIDSSVMVCGFEEPSMYLEFENDNGVWQQLSEEKFKVNSVNIEGSLSTSHNFNIDPSFYEITDSVIVKEISLPTANRKLRLTAISNLSGQQSLEHEAVTVIQHVAPSVSLSQLSYDATQKQITGQYFIKNLGTSGINGYLNLTKELCGSIQNKQGFLPNAAEQEDKVVFDYDFGDNQFIYMAPVLTTTLGIKFDDDENIYFTTEKTTPEREYEYVVCYNIAPTVSYRRNCLGINTTSFEDGSVLQINAYGDKNKIYLKYQDKQAIIDLDQMTIIGLNMNMDCGSW